MGKSKPSTPDPAETAAAQSAANRDTAITQQQLNMIDQVNPYGSVSYAQSGVNTYKDANGRIVETPKYTQTTTYTPEQQAIFDQTQAAQTNLAELANQQSSQLQESLANPFSFTNDDASNWAYDLGAQRLDPQFAQQQAALETQLANQGVTPGSRAWEAAMSQQSQAKNDAYNQLILNGQQQAYNQALTTYNSPVNTITALLSGSQVSNPSTQSSATPSTSVAGVDYTGLVNNQAAQQQSAYNSQLGGLFGLAGTLGGAALMSDRRLKTDIKRVGTTEAGVPVYTYKYIWGGPVQMGVMAQDVPDAAVEMDNGFLAVDYAEVR